MNTKPITPLKHAIIDYVFSAVQIVGPTVLGLDQKAIKTYAEIGASFLAVNSITKTGADIQPVIDMETHKKFDSGFLVAQALMTFTPMVRKNKKTLMFHLGFLAMAAANYLLTDYRKTGPTGPLQSAAEDLHKGDNAKSDFLKSGNLNSDIANSEFPTSGDARIGDAPIRGARTGDARSTAIKDSNFPLSAQ